MHWVTTKPFVKLLSPSTWPIFSRTQPATVESSFTPRTSAEALLWRAQQEKVETFDEFRNLAVKMNRSFDAAATDNFTQDFKGSYLSANAEMFPATYTTRARGRSLVMNTPHANGLMRVYADNVVGDDPFELEMEVGTKSADDGFVEETDTNEAIEKAWKRFCRKENFTTAKRMDFMEFMRVVEMARVHPGTAICQEHFNYHGNEFGFALRLLEQDRLQETYTGESGENSRFGKGNPIRASREYDKDTDETLAYWILNRHPSEIYAQTNVFPSDQIDRIQIPASEIIEFSNLRMRPEQDIGMTMLDATIKPLWRLYQFGKSLTLSSIASASKPWWIEEALPTGQEMPSEIRELVENLRLNGGAGGDDGKNPTALQTGNGTPIVKITPGSREKLPAGMVMKQGDPKFPIEGADQFQKNNEREISVATHGSYQQLTGDYQSLGFIAGLMSQQAFQRNMRVRQKSLIEDLRRMFRDWLKSAILAGYFDKRGQDILMSRLEEYVDGAKFKGQAWEFVNPLVEAQTLILLCEAGHLTRQDVQDRLTQGKKFSEVKAILKQEYEEMKEAGLPYGQAEATEPGVNKEGDVPPGMEKPEPSGTQDGGTAQPSPKSKKALPKSRNARSYATRQRGEIDGTTSILIEHSMNEH